MVWYDLSFCSEEVTTIITGGASATAALRELQERKPGTLLNYFSRLRDYATFVSSAVADSRPRPPSFWLAGVEYFIERRGVDDKKRHAFVWSDRASTGKTSFFLGLRTLGLRVTQCRLGEKLPESSEDADVLLFDELSIGSLSKPGRLQEWLTPITEGQWQAGVFRKPVERSTKPPIIVLCSNYSPKQVFGDGFGQIDAVVKRVVGVRFHSVKVTRPMWLHNHTSFARQPCDDRGCPSFGELDMCSAIVCHCGGGEDEHESGAFPPGEYVAEHIPDEDFDFDS